jgi:hypothetical protein
MAAPKRTWIEREAQLPVIEHLHNRGLSNVEIGATLRLSERVIRRDLDTIAQRYREEARLEHDIEVRRCIAALRDIRKEAWDEWERSKENKERRIQEKISERLDAKGEPTTATVQTMKAVLVSEGRLADNAYLTTVLRTLKEEAELLGFYAPRKVAPVTPDGNDEYNGKRPPSLDEFRKLSIEERIRLLRSSLGTPPRN